MDIKIPETKQKDYRVFIYWNNGFKYKFIGEVFHFSNKESFSPLLSLFEILIENFKKPICVYCNKKISLGLRTPACCESKECIEQWEFDKASWEADCIREEFGSDYYE